jgi:hypothetical protein
VDPEPFPTELAPSGFGEAVTAASVRNFFCRYYDSCLTTAVRRGWSDWTCARCALRGSTPPPSATRFAQDRRRDD